MSKCCITYSFYTTTTSGGATVTVPIIPPTQADQIPISVSDSVTGTFKWEPKDNPFKNISPTLAGKALVVSSSSTVGNIILEGSDIVQADEATNSLLDVNGVLSEPVFTKTGNTVHVTEFKINFVSGSTRTIRTIPAQDIVIAAAGTNTATSDQTYLYIDDTFTIKQTLTPPTVAQLRSNIYIAEVIHTDGGSVSVVKPMFTRFGAIQEQLRALYDAIGIKNEEFTFTFDRATGHVAQTNANAKLIGYNINGTGADKNVVPFPTANPITVEYYSFNPADRVPALTDFKKVYNIDNVAAGTSTQIPNGSFGILVLFASIDGKYLVLAPQQEYTSLNAARDGYLLYVSSVILPEQFSKYYVTIAAIVVAHAVTTNASTEFEIYPISSELGFNGGATKSASTLPAPSSGTAGDIVVVDPQTSSYTLKHDTLPDFSTKPSGEFVVTSGTGLTTQAITVDQINAGLLAQTFGALGYKLAIANINNLGVVTSSSGDFSILNEYIDFAAVTIDSNIIIKYPIKPYNPKKYIVGTGIVINNLTNEEMVLRCTANGYEFNSTKRTPIAVGTTFKLVFPFVEYVLP